MIDLDVIPVEHLPVESSVSALTIAELAAGTHAAADAPSRARRQELLQRVEASLETVPFDAAAARAYGRVIAATTAAGRTSRRRVVDLMIAATAASRGLPLFTRNPADVAGLEGVLEVVAI